MPAPVEGSTMGGVRCAPWNARPSLLSFPSLLLVLTPISRTFLSLSLCFNYSVCCCCLFGTLHTLWLTSGNNLFDVLPLLLSPRLLLLRQ
jgi:hypothetical protein